MVQSNGVYDLQQKTISVAELQRQMNIAVMSESTTLEDILR